jgi:hypothetical protein
MEDKFKTSFSNAGVGLTITHITDGLAKAGKSTLDTITWNDTHGWHCTIKDSISKLEVKCWGVTEHKMQEKALAIIGKNIDNFNEEQEREEDKELQVELERIREQERIRQEQEEDERRRLINSFAQDSNSAIDTLTTPFLRMLEMYLAIIVVLWLLKSVIVPDFMLSFELLLAILTFMSLFFNQSSSRNSLSN